MKFVLRGYGLIPVLEMWFAILISKVNVHKGMCILSCFVHICSYAVQSVMILWESKVQAHLLSKTLM